MKQGYRAIIIHHLFLAVTTLLMMKQTLVMIGIETFDPLKYFIIFLSTIIVYQLAASGIRFPFIATRIHKNKKWIVVMAIQLLLLFIIAVKTLSLTEIILLLLILFSCLGYFISIGSWKGLRAFPVMKGIVLAFAWSAVTVIFPLALVWNSRLHFPLFLQRFLFMLSICIVYNLRDVDADRNHGIVTIASLAGEKYTRIISILCLVLFTFSILFYNSNDYVKFALLLSAVITAIIISKAKINGSVIYYRYAVDGCMTLQSLFVILAGIILKN